MVDPSLLKKFQKWYDIASFRRWEQSLLGKIDLDWMSSNTTSLDSGVLIPFFQQKQLFHSKSYMLLPQIPYEPIYIQRVNSTNRVSLLDFCFRFGRNSLTFPGLGRLTVGTKALSCRIFLGHLKHVRGMEDGGCTGLKRRLYYHPPVKAKNPIFFSQFFRRQSWISIA